MYISSHTAALESNLSHRAHQVYIILRQYANNRTKECFVSKKTLCCETRLSLSTVTRSLRELAGQGLIKIVARFTASGRQTSNRYYLLEQPQMQLESPEQARQGIPGPSRPVALPAAVKSLSPVQSRVYSFLAALAGKKRECAVSRAKLAEGCNISAATAARALAQLILGGFLRRVRRTRWGKWGNHGNTSNLYLLTAPVEPLSARAKCALLLAAFLCLTPSPVSCATPQGTIRPTEVRFSRRGEKRESSQEAIGETVEKHAGTKIFNAKQGGRFARMARLVRRKFEALREKLANRWENKEGGSLCLKRLFPSQNVLTQAKRREKM